MLFTFTKNSTTIEKWVLWFICQKIWIFSPILTLKYLINIFIKKKTNKKTNQITHKTPKPIKKYKIKLGSIFSLHPICFFR
jgi:hypothetical protein